MLLAIDIGNTSTKFGIYDGELLNLKFSISTVPISTKKELLSLVGNKIVEPVFDAIVCSVVPELNASMHDFLLDLDVEHPLFVENNFDFGLKINYQPLSALGTDRIVNSFAAMEKYEKPCIVCSFGTATTFDVVDQNRELLGGTIAPGMKAMANALHLNTAKLPDIEIAKPKNVLGKTTNESIKSGVFYGHIASVEGMIRRIKNETGNVQKVIATGGFASLIADNTDCIDIVDDNLLLDGLRILHERIHSS